MNERIKQLQFQAAAQIPPLLIDSEWQREFVKKFSELIVRECYDIVINDGRFHDAKGIFKIGKYVAMEHFGVEE